MSNDYLTTYAQQLDEGDGATAWEPVGMWKPKVGDRVECRPSPECRVKGQGGSPLTKAGACGHPADELGAIGTLYEISDHPWLIDQGHQYTVRFDVPIMLGGLPCHLSGFALSELAPLDAATARPSDGQGEG